MRIGLYSTSTIPSLPILEGYGGVEPFVGSLAEYYDEHGHEVHLFAPKGSYEPKHGMLHPYNSESSTEATREYQMFTQYSKDEFKDLDIIHDNSHRHNPGAMLVPEKKYTVTFHAVQTHTEYFQFDKYHYNPTSLSYDYAKFINWMDSRLTMRTIQDGINLKYYPFKKEKGERFLWLSRIFPPKGAHLAIEIAERAKVPIDIVGGSPVDIPGYLDQLKRKCAHSEYAKFIGEVTHQQKIEYLQNARGIILPLTQLSKTTDGQTSLWIEAACMIPLEACACGTPVITTANGLTGEVVNEGINGFLAFSIDDFIDKVKRIDEIKPEMCRQRAEYFSFDRTAEKFLNVYEEIVNGRSW